jgi:hypothetical protein
MDFDPRDYRDPVPAIKQTQRTRRDPPIARGATETRQHCDANRAERPREGPAERSEPAGVQGSPAIQVKRARPAYAPSELRRAKSTWRLPS